MGNLHVEHKFQPESALSWHGQKMAHAPPNEESWLPR